MGKTQAQSFISLNTPLGTDVLILETLTGIESISRPFRFRLELFSEERNIKFEKLVGQRVSIKMDLPGLMQHRDINGFVSRFSLSGRDSRYTYYRAEVVPWLWLLSRSADCRIFQDLSAPQIIKEVFSSRQVTEFRDALEGDFPKLTYCVQYRERDIDFVSRLMEEHGISYYFEHDIKRHSLVLANTPQAYKECPGQPAIRYKEDAQTVQPGELASVVMSLSMKQRLRPGKMSVKDYNFLTPEEPLLATAPTSVEVGANTSYEIYDYPGRHEDGGRAEAVAKLRMEEREARHLRVVGRSTSRAIRPGYKIKLWDHYRADANREYLVVRVRHEARAGELTGDSVPQYKNEFVAIPADVPFRPPLRTPRPLVEGPQTARVVGPDGEEIHTDQHGRIKVQFHWDRKKDEKPENRSSWVRVSQLWAGKGGGALFLPRIGQEVIVDFLEGDPDRPIVTGRVYNAEEVTGYKLPDDRTRSWIKTNSSKGGGGFNELRFEDKAGQEEIFVHAQKDLNELVKNNHSTTVGKNQSSSAGENQSFSAGANQSLSAGANQSIFVKKQQTITVDEKDQIVQIKTGSSVLSVKVDRVVNTDGKYSVGAKDVATIVTDKDLMLQAKDKAQLKAKEIMIDGDQKIVMKVGASSITIEAGEITIAAPQITAAAVGIHQISGAVVKIN